MKRTIIAGMFIFLLSSCHKACHCNIAEVCFDNHCECGQWSEGNPCTLMRNKFVGKYAGTMSLNGGVPITDTISLAGDGYPAQYMYSYGIGSPFIKGFGIRVESSLAGVCYADYKQRDIPNQYLDNFNPIDCGNARITSDGKTLSLIYHPVIDPGQIDMSNEYIFVGTKQ